LGLPAGKLFARLPKAVFSEAQRRFATVARRGNAVRVAGDAAPDAGLLAEIERLQRELARAEYKIADLEARADIDPLTDIRNRRGFERELKRSLAHIARYGGAAALAYLDLDGFKAVNDRQGHAAGDGLLKRVAGALTAQVRASDVVGRLGGDEFAVLLWNVDDARAQAKARQLEAVVAAAGVGASAGVAMLTRDQTPEQAIAAADAAMYARKKQRRAA
jgi:diguanylate cyclase (GGDEF)-like protein